MRKTTFAVALIVVLAALTGGGVAAAKGGPGHGKGKKGKKPGTPSVKIFASGFNNPRGLTFGPGGKLRARGESARDEPAHRRGERLQLS